MMWWCGTIYAGKSRVIWDSGRSLKKSEQMNPAASVIALVDSENPGRKQIKGSI